MIPGIIGRDFDGPAVQRQPEMMGGLFMGKPHDVVATAVHPVLVFIGRLREASRSGGQNDCQ